MLFAFEINIRASAVLGLVGAGGIGLFYDSTLGLFQYPKTAMIILFTLVIVVIIDYVSSKVGTTRMTQNKDNLEQKFPIKSKSISKK